MQPLYQINFHLARNEDWTDVFSVTADDGTPIDLTGATFAMDIKNASGTTVLSLSTANGRLPVLDAPGGLMGQLILKAEVASNLSAGIYTHDCLMVQSARTRRLWYGQLTVVNGVTP